VSHISDELLYRPCHSTHYLASSTSTPLPLFLYLRGGLPQSRGYGFVEFAHHSHALACLRELNNSANPAYSDLASSSSGEGRGRLIVEFALENVRKVCRRDKIR
jgi:hypothetical protein